MGLLIDGALRAVKDGGLLSLAFSDLDEIIQPLYVFQQYGIIKQHFNFYITENNVRGLLSYINRQAAQRKKYVEPVLVYNANFHYRMFLRVKNLHQEIPQSNSYMLNCKGCPNYKVIPTHSYESEKVFPVKMSELQKNCEICESDFYLCKQIKKNFLFFCPTLENI